MMSPAPDFGSDSHTSPGNACFDLISEDIRSRGFSIQQGVVPPEILRDLSGCAKSILARQFAAAGIGRDAGFTRDHTVRSDSICWIDGETTAGNRWLRWADELKRNLNRKLMLGLFSFESHFAHFPPGASYQRHRDAFLGEKNRVLSILVYLNKNWARSDGGELVIYPAFSKGDGNNGILVPPVYGTTVLFLSEDFPHEVLPTRRDRYSVAGWFRVNSSTSRVNPLK